MGASSPLSVELQFPKSFCRLRINASFSHPHGKAEELAQKIDCALKAETFCPHIPEEILLLHKNIEQFEHENSLASDKGVLSPLLVEKVETKIRKSLTPTEDQAPSQRLINLYYLSQLSQIAPSYASEANAILEQTKSGDESISASIAQQLPHCMSEECFLRDLYLLTGLDRNSTVKILQQPVKISVLAERREKRRNFLGQPNAAEHPYLSQLLERGFFHLFDYLLEFTNSTDGIECRKEIRLFNASEISRIVLDVRHAIVGHVRHTIGEGNPNVVFLVGNTGSGKSTTAAFLQGEPLKKNGDRYEVPGQNKISHSLTVSCTFLPNVHSNQGIIYVDFPGFNDTRGDLINLGIELAFKALVDCYKPKVVVVESIKAIEESRGTHVENLGKDLKRMLGNKELCPIFLTQYLQTSEHVRLENACNKERELREQIAKLETAVSQREKDIESLKQHISYIAEEERKKIGELEIKVEALKNDIAELEERKLSEPLSSIEKRILDSYLKKLQKQERKLQQIKERGVSSREKQLLEEQVNRDEKEAEESREKILANKLGLEKSKEEIKQASDSLKEKTKTLLDQLDIGRKKRRLTKQRRLVKLEDLENPRTLAASRRVLSKTKNRGGARKELSGSYRAALIDRFKETLTYGGILPPPSIEINELQKRTSEISLTSVLTKQSFPEIEEFLHLPEMEPECVEKLDLDIVDEFSEALIRLIVIGSVNGDLTGGPIKDFIEEQINALDERQAVEVGQLKERWKALKDRVIENSSKKVTGWDKLENRYRSSLRRTLKKIGELKKQYLEDWDQWAISFFNLKDAVELSGFVEAGAENLDDKQTIISRATKIIDNLNRSFDKIRELRKIVRTRRKIREQIEECSNTRDLAEFLKIARETIDQIKEIYDKDLKNNEERWSARLKKIKDNLLGSVLNLGSTLQAGDCLAALMWIELRNRERSRHMSIHQLSETATGKETRESFQVSAIKLGAGSALENLIPLEKTPNEIAPMAQPRAVQLEERVRTGDVIQKSEEPAEEVATLSDMERMVVVAEQLLGVEDTSEEESLLNRARAINHELAKRVDLNLEIGLHRVLLLGLIVSIS